MRKVPVEIRVIFGGIAVFLLLFFLFPAVLLLVKAFQPNGGFGLQSFKDVLGSAGYFKILGNSFLVSCTGALVSTLLAFLLACAVTLTNLPSWGKRAIEWAAVLPMLLPTITYGFAILYSFGKQGFLTKLFGRQVFEIYGFGGLLLGYVVYTLPTAFLLIRNTMRYIDPKFRVVSRVMGDSPLRTFLTSTVRPLIGTLGVAFVQSFFLCFTDFGIPAAVGGRYEVIATTLYNQMAGSLPNFSGGAVVALTMLLPSILSILLLKALDKLNFRYSKISVIETKKNAVRDGVLGTSAGLVLLALLSVFAVILVIPFVEEWPYRLSFSLESVKNAFSSSQLLGVYWNSLLVAGMTALFGTLLAYASAICAARSQLPRWCKRVLDGVALVGNTVPGMVLGIAFLFAFTGTPLQNSFPLLILCNILHFFSTPYLMFKETLSKMNSGWETTALLMGDSWLKTIVRIVTPNVLPTFFEVLRYYFINSMVTISAVVFLAGARTMVITTKIKELQHYAKFDEIFVLSLLILITNLLIGGILKRLSSAKRKSV